MTLMFIYDLNYILNFIFDVFYLLILMPLDLSDIFELCFLYVVFTLCLEYILLRKCKCHPSPLNDNEYLLAPSLKRKPSRQA